MRIHFQSTKLCVHISFRNCLGKVQRGAGLTFHMAEHSAKLSVSYRHSGQIGFSSSGHFRRTVNSDAVRVAFRSMSAASADPMAVHQAPDTLRNDPAIRAANLTTYLGSF